MQLKEASERLAEVAAMDLTALTEGEVVELVLVSQRAAAMARAVHTAAVARLDVTKAFEADGARSAASWVAWRCGTWGTEAHATTRCGRELRSMARRSAARDASAKHSRPLLTVLLGEKTLDRICELSNGAIVTPGEVRDRSCVHPSCDVPAEQTQIDHLEPYEDGGLTVQDNGVCRCPFHHRLRHRRGSPPS